MSDLSRRDFLTLSLFGLAASGFPEAAAGAAVPAVVPDALRPARAADVRLEGNLGRSIDRCLRNRVMAQAIEAVVKPFREQKEIGDGDWRCEYWGKWYTSAVLACAYQPTPEHRAVVDRAVKELLATQNADGYIGTRKKPDRLLGWDVWGRKYVLLGLLAYYDLSGDEAVLQAARRHADSLLAECGTGKANIAEVGYAGWKGLPPSSVLEPVVLLYRRAGDRKYLDFARYIVAQWSKPNRLAPGGLRLVQQGLAGTPVAQAAAPKAYEMTSCYEGLCELYRATGERDYLTACERTAQSIIDTELFIVGSGSSREVWFGGRFHQAAPNPDPMETCVTATWMKYCYQLLRLTGDPRYADQMEISLHNALLGALKPDGSWWCYYTPLNGTKRPSHAQHADVGLSCCVTNGPRALMLTPLWAVMTGAAGPVVNLYNAGSASVALPGGGRVRIEQKSDYPVGERVELTVHPDRPRTFPLKLRIPAWSERTSLAVNGRPLPAPRAGSYAALHRRWQPGDRVTLTLDLRGRVVPEPGKSGTVAVTRGPVVLAMDRRLQPEGTAEGLSFPAGGRIELKPEAAPEGIRMAFRAACASADGKDGSVLLCDYASAGNSWSPASAFRTWLPQPLGPVDYGLVELDGAQWIWFAGDKGDPAVEAPAGTRYFRRVFNMPASAEGRRAAISVGADDTFVLYLNGEEIARGDSWQHPQRVDVTGRMKSGSNVLAAQVTNTTASPAGLIARLDAALAGTDTAKLLSGPNWRSSDQGPAGWPAPGFDDGGWPRVKVIAPYGAEPWGTIG